MPERTDCACPDIVEEEWHLQDLDWSGKMFYFVDLYHILSVPLSMDKVREKMFAEIAKKGYTVVHPERVLHQTGLLKGRLLVEIEDPEQLDANVFQFENVHMLTRVARSRSGSLKAAIDELKAFSQDKAHIPPRAIYLWPVTCEKCASSRGGDITILFAQI